MCAHVDICTTTNNGNRHQASASPGSSERCLGSDGIHRRSRYDFFTIWGNGLAHADSILDILRSEDCLEIISIEARRVKDMKRFVFDLYACDTVPDSHLRAKLTYLFNARSEVIIVFVRNLAPEETYVGSGAFRHIQCLRINRIKRRIRELYNPRANNVRTEEHVIHASDYEEQVDYVLKLLGYEKGIRYLADESCSLPFRKPHHIPSPQVYTFKTLALEQLRAAVLEGTGARQVRTSLVAIHQTPHYRALQGDPHIYTDYLERFRYTLLKDDYSWEKFARASQLSETQIRAFDPIIVTPEDEAYRILDGVHRAAILLNLNAECTRGVVFGR